MQLEKSGVLIGKIPGSRRRAMQECGHQFMQRDSQRTPSRRGNQPLKYRRTNQGILWIRGTRITRSPNSSLNETENRDEQPLVKN